MIGRSQRVAAEIQEAVDRGIEDDWKAISDELLRFRSTVQTGSGRGVLVEFENAGKLVRDAIDRRAETFLELCRGHNIRPDIAINPSFGALQEFITRLRAYRTARMSALNQSGRTSAEGLKAIETAEKALADARFRALQGYANGKLVYPRADWPKPWWSRLPHWIVTAASLLLKLTGFAKK
jgi:hypothetical protein